MSSLPENVPLVLFPPTEIFNLVNPELVTLDSLYNKGSEKSGNPSISVSGVALTKRE